MEYKAVQGRPPPEHPLGHQQTPGQETPTLRLASSGARTCFWEELRRRIGPLPDDELHNIGFICKGGEIVYRVVAT